MASLLSSLDVGPSVSKYFLPLISNTWSLLLLEVVTDTLSHVGLTLGL